METSTPEARTILDAQQEHWQSTFVQKPEMFGPAPSEPATKAAELFKREATLRILELGAGQGRDTLFFARNQFHVVATDYSPAALDAIATKANAMGVAQLVETVRHDAREPLPFSDGAFDACYSHMLYCMALTMLELEHLAQEVRRVLKPGGLCVYTVRHTGDAHYGKGIHRGEDIYEVGGFIVHFSTREKVERLARGYELLAIDEFDEGGLPRKLFRVTLRKPGERP